MKVFEQYESNVRSYCRSFPDIFNRAKGSFIYSENGDRYIDFLAGAGTLNYGHNNDYIKDKIIEYIQSDGISHGLDMHTKAKERFLCMFSEHILEPKGLNYKFQFCGCTGTNAAEAALKIARKVKNRVGVFSFMGGYHGMTLGSLAVTGNKLTRDGAGAPLNNVTFMPYPFGVMNSFDTINYIEAVITDSNSGIDKPASIIVETVQGEGGVVVAPIEWLQRLRALCDKHDILLICDEIQAGCHRTGPYFSFERAGIVPDIVLISKAIGGYGLPLSLVLMKPELDFWEPGQHTGTFRGNQLAFVGAVAAIEYALKIDIQGQVKEKELYLKEFFDSEIRSLSQHLEIRGIGLIWGIDFSYFGSDTAKEVTKRCFDDCLILERAGRDDVVVKLMPPLTIEADVLKEGCEVLRDAIKSVLG